MRPIVAVATAWHSYHMAESSGNPRSLPSKLLLRTSQYLLALGGNKFFSSVLHRHLSDSGTGSIQCGPCGKKKLHVFHSLLFQVHGHLGPATALISLTAVKMDDCTLTENEQPSATIISYHECFQLCKNMVLNTFVPNSQKKKEREYICSQTNLEGSTYMIYT